MRFFVSSLTWCILLFSRDSDSASSALMAAAMDKYDLEDTKDHSVQEDVRYVADSYPGQRTDQTRDERTRVRVWIIRNDHAQGLKLT